MAEFTWLFDDSVKKTSETWNQDEGKFIPGKVSNSGFDINEQNIDFLKIKKCQRQGCVSSDFYPRFFEYCPSCGANLIPVVPSFSNSWASPYGNPDGSRSLIRLKWNLKELRRINDVNEPDQSGAFRPTEFQLPEGGGKFAFLVTEGIESLIALDRVRQKMRVFSYSTTLKRWFRYKDSVPGFSAPPWAWSASNVKNGFIFPTDEGPCVVTLTEDGTGFFHNKAFRNKGACKGIGGAAVWEKIALVPVKFENNMVVAWRQCESAPNTVWERASVSNHKAIDSNDAFVGAAAIDGVNVFWSGEGGYLSAHIEKGVPEVIWHKWDDNIKGRPQFMPYRDRYNVLWQLCFDEKDKNYCFNRLSHGGVRDDHKVNGPHFAIGNKSFSDDKLYNEPWDDEPLLDYYPGQGQEYFIQPLFELSNGILYVVIRENIPVKEYINPKINVKYPFELAIRLKEGGDTRLLHGVNIVSPWDAEMFLFNGGLYIYLENQTKCWFLPNAYEDIDAAE